MAMCDLTNEELFRKYHEACLDVIDEFQVLADKLAFVRDIKNIDWQFSMTVNAFYAMNEFHAELLTRARNDAKNSEETE